MRAVILAAGKRERVGGLTEEKPKPLLLIRGKTFLEHIISTLPEDVDEVIVVIGYKGEQIRAFLGDTFLGKKVTYVQNDHLELGNAYSLLLTKDFFKPGERFIITYSDELPTKNDIRHCLEHVFSWLTYVVDDPTRSGVVMLSPSGRIIELEEKPVHPKSNIAAVGVLVVNADIFKCKPQMHKDGEYYLTSLMAEFMKTHHVQAVAGERTVSFSTPKDIDKFNRKG